VTDDWDRRCLVSTLSKFYCDDSLVSGHTFSRDGIFRPPDVKSKFTEVSLLKILSNSLSPSLHVTEFFKRIKATNLLVFIFRLETTSMVSLCWILRMFSGCTITLRKLTWSRKLTD